MAEGSPLHLECGGVIYLGYVEINLNIRLGTDQLSGFRWLFLAPSGLHFI